MAKFRYRMQSILDIKRKMETQAKMEFGQAQGRLLEEQERLEQLYQRKESYLEEARQIRMNSLNVRELRDNEYAMARIEEFIASQMEQVRKAEEEVEAAREKLKEVMMERKTHEKLREKAFEQFMRDENANESKEVDELTSYTYGQKRG